MASIHQRLHELREQIHMLEHRYGRPAGSVQLLAVTKNQPVTALKEAMAAGQFCFGESYLQEALEKQQQLEREKTDHKIEWHFIGPLQSNKTRGVAKHFDWLHSLDRLKLAQRLNEQRPAILPALNVCLQINISGEASKSGLPPKEVLETAAALGEFPRLRLRGLMAIPAREADFDEQRAAFRQLRDVMEHLNAEGYTLDTLSMGMTNDMEAAIAEGATIVRIGTGIFGSRD
jgi:pyridoxal phosphate enzyme (YggS family)